MRHRPAEDPGSAHPRTSAIRSESRFPGPPSVPRLLPHLERLDHVFDPEIVVADADTAFEALAHLGDVVLEPAQRVHRQVFRDDHAIPDKPCPAAPVDRAGAHDAARDAAHPGHAKDLADLCGAELHFLDYGLEHALEGSLDLIDRLVDNRVVTDIDTLAQGKFAHPLGRPDIEPDDDSVGCDGEVDVVLCDSANAPANDPQAHLLANVDLEQRVFQVLERHTATALCELRVALARLAAFCDLPGDAVVGDGKEAVARVGNGGEAEHQHRPGRGCRGDGVTVFIEHRPHPAECITAHDRVADVERAALD